MLPIDFPHVLPIILKNDLLFYLDNQPVYTSNAYLFGYNGE